MKPLLLSLGLGACLAALLSLGVSHGDGALLAAPTAVAVGVVAASALFGELNWLTVCCGALSPLAWTLLATRFRVDVGIAACLLLWAAPLWSSAKSQRELLAPVGAAVVSAGVGGVVLANYLRADLEHRLIACLFAGAALAMATSLAKAITPTAVPEAPAAPEADKPADTTRDATPPEPS